MQDDRLALLTDFYQITMLAGYFEAGKANQRSQFELYFRRLPFEGGYCIAGGLEPALRYLKTCRFEPEEIQYLRGLGIFSQQFLEWLGQFRFRGDVWAIPEGHLVFAHEPLLRVEAALPEAQLVESALLNIMNFQTLVTTKAARMYVTSGNGSILEFGLRRAQGINGALAASRAAYLGGCVGTSNTLAGKTFGIPVKGTMAHSWVMSFPTELEAFRAYARTYPDSCLLLVDTYDTLASGVPNAIRVGLELARQGHRLAGIRLDSGDLAHLSKEARRMMDEAGLTDAKIVASSDLDEHIIDSLRSQDARIDVWGVGTNLVTCKDEPALGGVYKLVAAEKEGRLEPRIKVSSNPAKTTIPGAKQVWRAYAADGLIQGDVLALCDESFADQEAVLCQHPLYAHSSQTLCGDRWEPQLALAVKGGEIVCELPSLEHLRQRTLRSLDLLGPEHKRLTNPHLYWVGLSPRLFDLKSRLVAAEAMALRDL
ncbi:MAG: nicotinate phosphoribosyltransferase [Armatimonadetes bacterium]|nr:nicotinate phosphoribosyltransferase [Armatimonadota bacterium]